MKTQVHADAGKQDMTITREFDLPIELLFRAYTEAEFIEQWMSTKVLKLDSRSLGSYQFETTDPKGNKYSFSGAIHAVVPGRKIIRTFEMGPYSFGVQLEVYEFESLTEDTSKLTMHVVYESPEQRDKVLQLPFTQGISMAHNRIEDIMSKIK